MFDVAEALGSTHTTLELPTDSAAQTHRRLRMKRKIYAAYHTHLQGTLTAFDEAFAASKGNMANVDFGHYVAAGKRRRRWSSSRSSTIDQQLPSQGPEVPGARRAEPGVGHRRHADRGDPADRAEERLEDPGVDRDGVRRAGGIGRRAGSPEVRRVLPERPDVELNAEQLRAATWTRPKRVESSGLTSTSGAAVRMRS